MNNISKTSVTHTQSTIFAKKGFLMLLFQLAIVFLMQGSGWGQTFTPVEYNFSKGNGVIGQVQNGVVSGNTYTDYKTNTTHSFSIVSSASNGYGTWAATSDGRWLLLGDTLTSEISSDASHSVPSGVIQSGVIPFPTGQTGHVKVVTNLNGAVRFIWIDPTSNVTFYVAGFDASDISIGMRSGYPNATGTRDIVTGTMHISPPLKLFFNLLPAPANCSNGGTPEGGEIDWRDYFDAAMDGSYAYIAYSSRAQQGGGELQLGL